MWAPRWIRRRWPRPPCRLDDRAGCWRKPARCPPPMLIVDERVAAEVLDGLAAQIDLPTVEAGALINGREVQVTAGQVGRQLDVSATLDSLAGATAGMTDAAIDLPVRATDPPLSAP